MLLRAFDEADTPGLEALHAAYDTHWYGAPELSTDEVVEFVGLSESACLVLDGERVIGHAGVHRTGSIVLADPAADPGAVYRLLVDWLVGHDAPEIEALDRDEPLKRVLAERGWRHTRSMVDLERAAGPVDEPRWPAGVQVRTYTGDDAAALHSLLYDDAGWAEIDGHHHRDLDEWHRIFLCGRRVPELPVLVEQDGRLVAAAVLRHFDDGTGWVAQLAVARSHRRRGLARALLLESFTRLLADGSTTLGLSVYVTNRGALDLYLSTGLTVHREWQTYVADTRAAGVDARG